MVAAADDRPDDCSWAVRIRRPVDDRQYNDYCAEDDGEDDTAYAAVAVVHRWATRIYPRDGHWIRTVPSDEWSSSRANIGPAVFPADSRAVAMAAMDEQANRLAENWLPFRRPHNRQRSTFVAAAETGTAAAIDTAAVAAAAATATRKRWSVSRLP